MSEFSRRDFLTRTLAVGCSAAASPLVTPVAIASDPGNVLGNNRLVVIILRGGMDGLGVVQPWGDPDFAALRGQGTRPGDPRGPIALTDYYAVHQALEPLMPLWQAGELGFVNAVSTPYRNRRSHFDGQDLLEAGVTEGTAIRDGWLNRMLQTVPGLHAETAYTIGASGMLLTKGAARVSEWSPQSVLAMTPQSRRLMEEVMHDDPLFRDVLTRAFDLSESSGGMAMMQSDRTEEMLEGMAAVRQGAQLAKDNAGAEHVARFAARRLKGDARIAAFSVNGWDTHARQDAALRGPLSELAQMILTLMSELGPVWGQTGVIAMTEFGRTARLNGTDGTDHGTGGTMVLAGGALRGGQVHGRWPGLAEADLYDRRDLMPTSDVRAQAAWVMRGLFGLSRDVLEGTVFPGLDLGSDPGLIRV
ncbi:DUF1501 domain-containing protein [Pseudooceanicola sp. MF1-13]|uniref:DUF1501 domain-containing protein n=1 Tax=Pseudooceanicola sp. MF1-13 TaxID=3379095 RepID=UPI0038924545